MALRNLERLTQLDSTSTHLNFLFLESAIGIVEETAANRDSYASDRLTRSYNHIARLEGIKRNYSESNTN
ncbi:MAG: hypothetical protein AABY10_05945 [Nanoarchaeota archaeon]